MSLIVAIEYTFFIASFLYFVYLISFFKLIFYRASTATPQRQSFISVLICAKNEAKNLLNNLPIILEQNHPSFEVIVVNDQSTDQTLHILQEFKKKNTQLKVYSTTGESNKKTALSLAKEKALGNIYVLTDADCKVASKKWLSKMVVKIEGKSQVVLGYAPHVYQSGFLNKLQRFETLTTALQYTTAALFNSPYMGVGRNLAYTKQIDKKIKFNENKRKLLSGDDDLWIQQAKKHSKMQIQLAEESYAYSKAEPDLKSWWNQKRRHISAADQYIFKDQLLLSGVFLTKFFFWLSFFMLAWNAKSFYFWFTFTVIITIMLIVYKSSSDILKEKNIWWLSPVLDFSMICFQLSLFISNLVSPIKKWK